MARLMASKAVEPMMQKAAETMQMVATAMRGEGFDADLLDRMIAEYQGDLVVSFAVDWQDAVLFPMGDDEPEVPFAMTIALTPHASYDLAPLAQAVDGAMRKKFEGSSSRQSKELAIGDHRLTAVFDGTIWGTIPTLVDGHLVMFFGNEIEAAATKAIEGKERFEAADAAAKPMFLHADLRGFVGAMERGMADMAEATGETTDFGMLLDTVGLRAMESLRMTVGADGKHSAVDLMLGMRSEKRGLFAMLPQTTAQPKLLRMVPAGVSQWSVVPLDLGALYASAEQFVTLLEEQMPMSWPDMMSAMAEELKVRLKEDLLDHMGQEAILISSAETELDDTDSPMAGIDGMCAAFALRDGAAFGKSLETMLRARGLHAARKTEEYQGAKIHRMTVAAVLELEYAVVDDLLLLALGSNEEGRAALRGILDAKASGTTSELPAAVKAHLDAAPPGWSGIGLTRQIDTMRVLATQFESLMPMMEADGDDTEMFAMVISTLKGVADEMQRLGMEAMVAFTYCNAAGIGYHLRW
jgi:hypothetical protein